MRYEVLIAPGAVEDFEELDAQVRATGRDAIERHLRHQPARTSKTRIGRLRGLTRPQFRLRVREVRAFHDVVETRVEVLARILRLAEKEEVLITRHGKPAGVLGGVESEVDWFGYRREHDRRFLARIEAARRSLRAGRGVRLEDFAERQGEDAYPRLQADR